MTSNLALDLDLSAGKLAVQILQQPRQAAVRKVFGKGFRV